jgi:hypothetical protein
MSMMLRNFQYLSGGTANGQYPSGDLEANIAAATTGTALRAALGIEEYATNAAALTGGLSAGDLYFNTGSSTYVLVQAP